MAQPSIIFLDNGMQVAYSWWVRIDAGPALPWAVTGRGRTPAELRARSGASSPRTRGKKGLMVPYLPSLSGTDCMATLGPLTARTPKAENILKTKGQKRAFSQNKAENMLKKSQLQEAVGAPKKHDKMTAGRDPHGRWQAAEQA